jgi:thioredoxin reductase (NADPH)
MSKPTILTVDDDPVVSAAIAHDLRSRYGAGYRVVRVTSGSEALAVLTKLALRDQPVALIVADQRMPQMTGIEMLEQARTQAPGAKYLLLTAYADTDVAITAINDIGLDYYLLKPWDPPEERLYPVIDDLLGDWQQAHPDHTSDVRVVGHRWSERSHEIKTFLARNHVPYRWCDIERPTTRSCSCPTATRSARRPRLTSPVGWACAPAPSSRCTTCASWAAARPASPPRCTRPRRA